MAGDPPVPGKGVPAGIHQEESGWGCGKRSPGAGRALVVDHKGVITDNEKAAMPLEGAYTIVDWLLKCTQQVNDNIIMPMQRSMKDALHHQDEEAWKEVQAAAGGVDKEKSQKERLFTGLCQEIALLGGSGLGV